VCSSLNVRDHVSHPYRTTGKITVLYIVTFNWRHSEYYASTSWFL
jgi:hypothetical protein